MTYHPAGEGDLCPKGNAVIEVVNYTAHHEYPGKQNRHAASSAEGKMLLLHSWSLPQPALFYKRPGQTIL